MKRVVIIGAGFGGINAAKAFKGQDIEVVIIDKTNHHLFQPLLYQVASAALSPADIATPIRTLMRKQKNVSVIMSEATSIDKEKKQVVLTHADPISFDYLILAPGARHSYFNNLHWEAAAPGIKTLQEAVALRDEILMSFEVAERISNKQEIDQYLTFVIIGAGPTGVELAGAIAEIAFKTAVHDFKHIDTLKSKIYLVEAAPQILPGFAPKLQERAKKDLEKLGVTVLVDTKVLDVTHEGVEAVDVHGNKRFFSTTNAIWAAGNQAAPLLKTLDTPLDRQGRVIVEKDLTLPNYPHIFVIGDAAHVVGKKGTPLPAVATAAIQQGKYVARLILSSYDVNKRPIFVYRDKGSMATIGVYKAIASIGPFKFGGLLAWLAWSFIHVAYLISFRNRLIVMMQWMIWLITGKRISRVITTTLHLAETPPPSPK